MKNAVKFRQSNLPKQAGERARLKVIQGPDFGCVFAILGGRVSIGRGDENDVVISDLKASRVHAQISFTGSGGWVLLDQKSANGVLLNGERVEKAKLRWSDVISLGETTFEFVPEEAGTGLIMAPARSMDQVLRQQKAFDDARRQAVGFGSASGYSPASESKSGGSKILLYGVGIVALFVLLMDEPSSKSPSSQKKKEPSAEKNRDLASYLPTSDYNRTVETLFKDGMREYFERNYGRAKSHFETVLQINPNHTLATIYLENCNQAVQEEIKHHLSQGKKTLQAGKLRSAKGHYEWVIRFLARDQSNPAFIEASDQLQKILKVMRGENDSS
ncbi:MAG: FHA domain-containing protein [Bdellovibrionia bacterium]